MFNNVTNVTYDPQTRIIDIPRERTAPLLAKVLGLTSLAFLVTAIGVYTAPAGGSTMSMILVFGLIFAISWARRKSPAVGISLFFVLAYFMGWMIGPIIHHYVASFGPSIVLDAAATTGVGMASMGIIAYIFSIDYRRLTGIASMALLLLIVAGLVSMFFHFISPNLYSILTLLIFTALTIGDFARIRAGGDGQSAVSLALSIYLDAINIFLAVLQLFGGRRRS